MTIGHCGLLLSVLCLSATGPLAQDNIPAALVTNKDEEALAKHRLTIDNVQRLFAVERELLNLMREMPDWDARAAELERSIDPHGLAGSLVRTVKVYEGIPEIARILERQKVSAREYLLTKMTAMSAEMLDEALRDERLRHEYEKSELLKYVTMSQALQFWRAMDPALKAEAAEWKKVREEMARLER